MSKRPPEPEVEWTVDQAPDEAEVSHGSDAARTPLPENASLWDLLVWRLRKRQPASRYPLRASRRHFAWAAALLVVLLLAALGLWAFTRASWNRLQAQVAAEIAYEDEQSLARQPGLVRGLQAPESEAWLDLRAAEAALGLPAPRPAPQLSPAAQPAQILEFNAAGPDRFDVTVVRAYTDSAGQMYRFTLRQRYHTPGPGLWERLPPDEAALIATAVWQGARLAATLPAADQALLTVVLPAVEAYAQEACADWNCPAELSVPLVFTGWLAELPPPGPVAGADPHPIAFDLALAPQPAPRRLVLPAPTLSGNPLDEAARVAYTNGLSAAVLAHIAGELAGTGRRPADFYLDALIAREERRLGLSPESRVEVAAADYSPPEALWNVIEALDGAAPEGETARRAQALAYLDLALHSQPATADGALLDTLRRRRTLADWLSPIVDWEVFSTAWIAAQSEAAGRSAVPASALDGLAYQCPDQTVLHDGAAAPVAPVWPIGDREELFALHPLALSPDERYLATIGWTANGRLRLSLWDRQQNAWSQAAEADQMLLVGWTAEGELLYAVSNDQGTMNLMGFRPDGAAPERLFDAPLWPDWPSLDTMWSADHRNLALTLVTEDAPWPAIWRAAASNTTQTVGAHAGLYSTLSPDGRWLVYVPWSAGPDDQPFASSIRLVDLEAGAETVLLNRDTIGGGSAPAFFSLLHWSPDSRTLAFLAASMSGSANFYTVDTHTHQITAIAGGPGHSITPAGFSADGRFLAYLDNVGNTNVLSVMVHEVQSGSATRLTALTFDHLRRAQTGLLPSYPTGVAAWSPRGHMLAVSSPSGVFVSDPATGDMRWVTFEPCGRVVWYSLE